MATLTYDEIIRAAQQLPPDEQWRLRHELTPKREAAPSDLSAVLLALPALDPGTIDEIERAIEEGCEQINSSDG